VLVRWKGKHPEGGESIQGYGRKGDSYDEIERSIGGKWKTFFHISYTGGKEKGFFSVVDSVADKIDHREEKRSLQAGKVKRKGGGRRERGGVAEGGKLWTSG